MRVPENVPYGAGFVRDKRFSPLPTPSEFSDMFTILLSFPLTTQPARRVTSRVSAALDSAGTKAGRWGRCEHTFPFSPAPKIEILTGSLPRHEKVPEEFVSEPNTSALPRF
jgi:hypothetical protein